MDDHKICGITGICRKILTNHTGRGPNRPDACVVRKMGHIVIQESGNLFQTPVTYDLRPMRLTERESIEEQIFVTKEPAVAKE